MGICDVGERGDVDALIGHRELYAGGGEWFGTRQRRCVFGRYDWGYLEHRDLCEWRRSRKSAKNAR